MSKVKWYMKEGSKKWRKYMKEQHPGEYKQWLKLYAIKQRCYTNEKANKEK